MVIVGDVAEPRFGLDEDAWQRLAHNVDLVVHPAALVNHVLPYSQLFGPNVVGTAEVIRLAITSRRQARRVRVHRVGRDDRRPGSLRGGRRHQDGQRRAPGRRLTYANGYGNSKWAGEVLLREAHDLCGLPVTVFRSGMILAHRSYAGQLNVPDMFTRLIFSVLATGLAPTSFYVRDADGHRQRSHYDGLPVDFVAEAITTLGAETTSGFRSLDVMNPHDDGISLDVFVDWLVGSGDPIARIDDYDDWFRRFETALRALPEQQRQQSVLPLLHAYRRPEAPVQGSLAPAEAFQAAVRAAKIGVDQDVPHLTPALIEKYVIDLEELGVLQRPVSAPRPLPRIPARVRLQCLAAGVQRPSGSDRFGAPSTSRARTFSYRSKLDQLDFVLLELAVGEVIYRVLPFETGMKVDALV